VSATDVRNLKNNFNQMVGYMGSNTKWMGSIKSSVGKKLNYSYNLLDSIADAIEDISEICSLSIRYVSWWKDIQLTLDTSINASYSVPRWLNFYYTSLNIKNYKIVSMYGGVGIRLHKTNLMSEMYEAVNTIISKFSNCIGANDYVDSGVVHERYRSDLIKRTNDLNYCKEEFNKTMKACKTQIEALVEECKSYEIGYSSSLSAFREYIGGLMNIARDSGQLQFGSDLMDVNFIEYGITEGLRLAISENMPGQTFMEIVEDYIENGRWKDIMEKEVADITLEEKKLLAGVMSQLDDEGLTEFVQMIYEIDLQQVVWINTSIIDDLSDAEADALREKHGYQWVLDPVLTLAILEGLECLLIEEYDKNVELVLNREEISEDAIAYGDNLLQMKALLGAQLLMNDMKAESGSISGNQEGMNLTVSHDAIGNVIVNYDHYVEQLDGIIINITKEDDIMISNPLKNNQVRSLLDASIEAEVQDIYGSVDIDEVKANNIVKALGKSAVFFGLSLASEGAFMVVNEVLTAADEVLTIDEALMGPDEEVILAFKNIENNKVKGYVDDMQLSTVVTSSTDSDYGFQLTFGFNKEAIENQLVVNQLVDDAAAALSYDDIVNNFEYAFDALDDFKGIIPELDDKLFSDERESGQTFVNTVLFEEDTKPEE